MTAAKRGATPVGVVLAGGPLAEFVERILIRMMEGLRGSGRYMVMDRRAKMPTSCWGGDNYRRVGIVAVNWENLAYEQRAEPSMISDRARGVMRVVVTWERLYEGKTERCAFRRALDEAIEECRRMNMAYVRKLLGLPPAEDADADAA